MSEYYYVDLDGNQLGPINEVNLKAVFSSKKINKDSLVWNAEIIDWTPIAEVPGLLAKIETQKIVLPPPINREVVSDKSIVSAAALAAKARAEAMKNKNNNSETDFVSAKANIAAVSSGSGNNTLGRGSVVKELPSAKPENDWVELVTADKQKYYFNKALNLTQWDKPDCLKTIAESDKDGEWVWAPHETDAFIPAKIIAKAYDGSITVEFENGKSQLFRKGVVLESLSWSSLRSPPHDLVLLDVMNHPLILHTLRSRFNNNHIYTNVGNILISVNPFKPLPLYSPAIIDAYRRRGNRELDPHVYTIASDSYNNLVDGVGNCLPQSIIISGESGAGKTEATKQCLQYLAETAGSDTYVEQKILLANPILEAFGNAKTVRNNNSSRFGKYIEIFFESGRASIAGARNTQYLLEKTRVVKQSLNERNYHVFYQLVKGCDPELRKILSLTTQPKDYQYLAKSGCIDIPGVSDADEYKEVLNAMQLLNFKEEDKIEIFKLVGSILHLGNIKFESTGDKACKITNSNEVDAAASLLGVKPIALQTAIINRVFAIRGQASTNISLSVQDSSDMRDAISKFVYSRLFDWLVTAINSAIWVEGGKSTSKMKTIGILDIFGFEIFEMNSLEQLFINFANEKLQQQFNANTFKNEEVTYMNEKIAFTHVPYIDNQPVLDLIENKPYGLLSMLDEELRMPNGSNKSYVEKLNGKFGVGCAQFEKCRSNPDHFTIRHYAGQVIYQSVGFLEKNKDSLTEDVSILFNGSENQFLQTLFPPESNDNANRKASVGFQFQVQLTSLMAALNATQPHYIRCIKPNPNKKSDEFISTMVLEQLRYSGVFEAVQIRKSGYPFRLPHDDFVKRFRVLILLTYNKLTLTQKKDQRNVCKVICDAMNLQTGPDGVQIGVSRVLYRAHHHKAMELSRNLAVEKTVVFLQARFRKFLSRRLLKELKRAKPILQAAIKIRTLEALESALEKCSKIKFPLAELTKARFLKHKIVEEARLIKVLSALIGKDPEEYYDDYAKALASAEAVQMESDLVDKCRAGFVIVEERRKCRLLLQSATKAYDEQGLRDGLAMVSRMKMKTDAIIEAAVAAFERIEIEKVQHVAQLNKGSYSGGFLKEGDVIVTDILKRAVEASKAFGMKTLIGIELEKQSNSRLLLRIALRSAQSSPKERYLWNNVDNAIIACGPTLSNDEELLAAQGQVALHAEIDVVLERLIRAAEMKNESELSHWIQAAKKLKMDATPQNKKLYPQVSYCDFLRKQISACREYQTSAVYAPNVNLEELEYAVALAETLGYTTEQTETTRDLWLRVADIHEKSIACARILNPEDMKRVVAEGDSLRMKTDEIEHLRTLLYRTPEEKFVQLQLKAAVSSQDPARRIRLTIKLKDIFLKRTGDQFSLNKFGKLRSAKEWAEESFFTWNKEALAASFWKHSKDHIHATLIDFSRDTRNDEEDEKAANYSKSALNLFKNILGFMGDRQLPFPTLLCKEILEVCLEFPVIRDEIYLQIIKQLTSNPSNDSVVRGWKLLQMCLETFPPNPDFENFLETWLRSSISNSTSSSPFSVYQATFTSILHSTVYGGAMSSCPSELDIEAVIAGRLPHFLNSAASALEKSQNLGRGANAEIAIAAAALSNAELSPSLFDQPIKILRVNPDNLAANGFHCPPIPVLGNTLEEELARQDEFEHFNKYAREQAIEQKAKDAAEKIVNEENNKKIITQHSHGNLDLSKKRTSRMPTSAPIGVTHLGSGSRNINNAMDLPPSHPRSTAVSTVSPLNPSISSSMGQNRQSTMVSQPSISYGSNRTSNAPVPQQSKIIMSHPSAPKPPAPKPPPKPVSNWKAAMDPESGQDYYYNSVTGEVTWDKPAEMD